MPAWLDGVKTRLGMIEEEEPAEQTLLQQLDSATTLDRTQRAIGFATCAGIGLMLSFLVRTPLPRSPHPAGRSTPACRINRSGGSAPDSAYTALVPAALLLRCAGPHVHPAAHQVCDGLHAVRAVQHVQVRFRQQQLTGVAA